MSVTETLEAGLAKMRPGEAAIRAGWPVLGMATEREKLLSHARTELGCPLKYSTHFNQTKHTMKQPGNPNAAGNRRNGPEGGRMPLRLSLHPTAEAANTAAAELLCHWLAEPGTRSLMVAGGNTPLDLYRRVAERRPPVSQLTVFILDEYVGVPPAEPRNCASLLRRSVAEAWGISRDRFFAVTSDEREALAGVRRHEQRIAEAGGLDVIVLGLGQNGHLGFNEPGSAPDSTGRVLELDAISVEANRKWFGGHYAPAKGVTVGLKTILAARRVLILAFGSQKAAAVRAMVRGPVGDRCPASFLQRHPHVHAYLDREAAAGLNGQV